jgi:pimeloyl-ACP methyl ester carboxylesterase
VRVRKVLLVVAGVVALAIALLALRPAFTPPIRSPGVASLEQITLGGTAQWVLIRGRNRKHPLALFLHGGPGMPLMYLAHSFQPDLENDFVVVQWDRRGAGKSYSPNIDPKLMRMSQELSDAERLIELLRQRFGQTKVIVIGHSYGTLLGIELAYRRPDLVRAYVGVGQVACGETQAEAAQDAWLREMAMAAGDTKTLAAINSGESWNREAALFQYGGEVVGMRSDLPLIMRGLLAPEYTLRDGLNVPKGVAFTHRYMVYDLLNPSLPLIDNVPKLAVPVYFFTGRHDYTTPFSCTERYYEGLDDAFKHLIWFDRSAHFPFLEEPQRFHQALLQVASDTAAPPQGQ